MYFKYANAWTETNTTIINQVKDALNNYLDKRFAQSKEDEDDPDAPLFLSLKNQRISVRNVQVLVKKYAQLTTPLKKITPHKLRTTFGTNLYSETNDIYIVAEVLGHKDVNTTKKHYAAISEQIKREASTHVNLRKKDEDSEDNSWQIHPFSNVKPYLYYLKSNKFSFLYWQSNFYFYIITLQKAKLCSLFIGENYGWEN